MDREKDKIGYEIPFTKFFYEYKPLRDLKEIMQNIEALEEETEDLLTEIKTV
jgi:type I restriction enzyme M protein